jgi:dienelactone hydrolase
MTPTTSRLAQPVSITATGLEPHSVVRVTLSSTDEQGVHWSSSARFRSNEHGVVDLDHDKPRSGAYTGGNGMGLMEALAPKEDSAQGAYFAWPGLNEPQDFRVTVSDPSGQVLARSTFRRELGAGVRSRSLTVPEQGFDGVYYRKGQGNSLGAQPAVLSFGGSEGGNRNGALGAALASAGYPTLTLAYFGAPGLPKDLVKIPLEYFAKALRWLRRQPGVDPHRIYILGVSRGSEAAQLVAVHYAKLVHGIIASVPSGVVHVGLRKSSELSYTDAGESAWSYRGRPIPYALMVNTPHPKQVPESVIPVEKIRGPMFLVCADADSLWISCRYSRAIVQRLKEHNDPYRHELVNYSRAGHGVGTLVPYEPAGPRVEGALAGLDPLANQRSRADVWPKLMTFLGTTSPG